MRRLSVFAIFALAACKQDYEVTDLVGGDGELRFNLEFTNEENVDVDLHVVTPGGFEIYYADLEDPATGGQLDVDCHCTECTEGPNENIFWPTGAGAASGEYQVSVVYYGSCDFDYYYYDTGGSDETSDYTLRVLENGQILETYTGTLASDQIDEYSHEYD